MATLGINIQPNGWPQVLENRKDEPEFAEDEKQRRKRIYMGNDPFFGAVPGTELFKKQHFRILTLAAEEQAKELAAQSAASDPNAAGSPAGQARPPQLVSSSIPTAPRAADSAGQPSQFLPPHVPAAHAPGATPSFGVAQGQGSSGAQPAPPATPQPVRSSMSGGSLKSVPEREAVEGDAAPSTSAGPSSSSSETKPPGRGPGRRLEYTNCAPTAPPRAGFDLQILGGAIVGQALLAVAHDWVTGGQPANLRIQWQRLWVEMVNGTSVRRAASVSESARYFIVEEDKGCRLRAVAATLDSSGAPGPLVCCDSEIVKAPSGPPKSPQGAASPEQQRQQEPGSASSAFGMRKLTSVLDDGGSGEKGADPRFSQMSVASGASGPDSDVAVSDTGGVGASGGKLGGRGGTSIDMGEDDDHVPAANRKSLTLQAGALNRRRYGINGKPTKKTHDAQSRVGKGPTDPAVRTVLVNAMAPHFLFSNLTTDALELFIDAMFEQRVREGECVIRQGEPGDNFYVAVSGEFDVFVTPENGGPKYSVTHIKPGGTFGELALMYNAPRAATVLALKDSVVWGLGRSMFQQLVERNARGATVRNFIREVPLFAYMNDQDLAAISNEFVEKTIKAGEIIIKTGEIGGELSIIKEGSVNVVVRGNVVRVLEKRMFFGEGALISGEPRTADVVARTDVTLLCLTRQSFERLLHLGLEDIFDFQLKLEALQNVPTLERLTNEQVANIAERFVFQKYPKGTVLLKQGEEPTAFFVIKTGRVTVLREGPNGEEVVIGTLGTRSGAGARAMLEDTVHPASVVVSSDGLSAFWLSAENFRILLRAADRDKRVRMLQEVPILRSLLPSQLGIVADHLRQARFNPGVAIVQKGAPGNKMYLVKEGTIAIMKGKDAKDKNAERVGTITTGGYFGERALLATETRPYTMLALTACQCLSLDGSVFDPTGPCAGLRDRLLDYIRMEQSAKVAGAKLALNELGVYRTLGIGKFGRVKLVEHKRTGTPFALKMISKRLLEESGQEEHLRNEVTAMKEIDHPFCAKLVVTFSDRSWLYMLLELCLGGELFKIQELQPNQRFTEPVAMFYAACVASALEHLHNHDIIYRDLKPENLLLDAEGYIKVVDFGFAKKVDRVGGRTFTLCGTADYLAPEIILVQGHGREVDIWAMGVLIYEMLVGRAPFVPLDKNSLQPGGVMVNPLKEGEDPSAMLSREKNILSCRYYIPQHVSMAASNLIQSMLIKDQRLRLGCGRSGFMAIKNHSWFRGTDWDRLLLKKLPAPIVPQIKHPLDASNFDVYDEEVDDDIYDGTSTALDDIF